MESIIQTEDMVTVYDILGTLFEKVKEKCSYILNNKMVPEDLRSHLDTIIFASYRIEIEELHQFRENLRRQYGNSYISDASCNKAELCNVNVVEKLRIKTPQEETLINRLKQLSKEFGLENVFPQTIPQITNLIDNNMMNNNSINPNIAYNHGFEYNPNQQNYSKTCPNYGMNNNLNYYNMNNPNPNNTNLNFNDNFNQFSNNNISKDQDNFNLPSQKTILESSNKGVQANINFQPSNLNQNMYNYNQNPYSNQNQINELNKNNQFTNFNQINENKLYQTQGNPYNQINFGANPEINNKMNQSAPDFSPKIDEFKSTPK